MQFSSDGKYIDRSLLKCNREEIGWKDQPVSHEGKAENAPSSVPSLLSKTKTSVNYKRDLLFQI